jgi:hypothetical protein
MLGHTALCLAVAISYDHEVACTYLMAVTSAPLSSVKLTLVLSRLTVFLHVEFPCSLVEAVTFDWQ